MVTDTGTVATSALLDVRTTSPPTGAAEPMVTVAVLDLPPFKLVGLSVSDFRIGPLIVKLALSVTVPNLAVTVTAVCELTANVLTVNVPVALPAGTVTVGGKFTEVELLDNATTIPPVPALALNVTVPVVDVPPRTVVGLTLMPVSAGAVIVKLALTLVVPDVAVIVAVFNPLTATVFTVKVFDVLPAAIVKDEGTVAEARLLDNLTTTPPVGA